MTVGHDDLFHDCQSESLSDTTFDLSKNAERIECTTNILRGRNLNDLHETELGIDIDHCAMRNKCERCVAVALPIFVKIFGGLVVILDRLVE